jgi:hypothetical protein
VRTEPEGGLLPRAAGRVGSKIQNHQIKRVKGNLISISCIGPGLQSQTAVAAPSQQHPRAAWGRARGSSAAAAAADADATASSKCCSGLRNLQTDCWIFNLAFFQIPEVQHMLSLHKNLRIANSSGVLTTCVESRLPYCDTDTDNPTRKRADMLTLSGCGVTPKRAIQFLARYSYDDECNH